VAFYTPLTKPEQLPKLGADIEREVMDWKAPGAVGATPFHKAKDVAAFANHLGGVILVGVCEGKGGKLSKYERMNAKTAQQVADAFSRAIEQKCDPVPDIDPVPFESDTAPGQVVLAVNVAPSLRLVGVKAEVDKKVDGWDSNDKAFVYPVRTGTVTRFLRASELPMMMTPHVRRVAVLLSRIPVNERIRIIWHGRDMPEFLFLGVDEEKNVMRYKHADKPTERTLPLDGIASVYEGETSPDDHRFGWRIIPSSDLIASRK
jgi:hypothetical protein